MTTGQTIDDESDGPDTLPGILMGGFKRRGQMDGGEPAACTSDAKGVDVFAVQIDQDSTIEHIRCQGIGAFKTNFLTNGKQKFQWAVLQVLLFDDCQTEGNAYPVICPKGCALGLEPVAFPDQLDRIGIEIKLPIALFFTDHIEVTLQDNDRSIPDIAAGRFRDDQVAYPIDPIAQTYPFGDLDDILSN